MAYDPTKWEHGDLIIANKLNKIESALSNISDNAVFDTDGLSPIGYVNSGDPMPANPKKDTTVFVKDGNDFIIYSFDGEDWVPQVDPDLKNRIEETIKTASDNTDKAIADNSTQINETIHQVTKEKIDLALKDADFNEKAQEMADKALADAKVNTAQAAQEALNSANKQIEEAKKDINDTINAFSVGGRNLLLGTRDWTDNTRWDQRGTVTKETYRGMAIASTSKPWWSPRYSVRYANILQVGKTYTFSTYVRNTSDTDTKVTGFYDYGRISVSVDTTPLPAHTDWMRVSTTFKVINPPTDSASELRWEGHDNLTNGFIQFAGYKLEEGNIPTDWTPAPEDVQSDIAQVKITADSISNIVYDPTKGLSVRVQTAEGTLNTVKSTADGAMSTASQTANDIKQEIQDRTTGDSNTLQSSKDFTTSQITNSETGTKSLITQTADGIMAKVDTKTDSDTVLSLLKHHWSIGITDNLNKITSGIVGNTSQMSLISKNVTIDSPNTQIKGKAWINSAMIQKGSIVSANIAEATITSANIATLDVVKLTGDVTSFVKSYWNSAYGNVTITPDKVSLQSYSGSSLLSQMDISNTGIFMKMPSVSSFLDSTLINENGMSFQHNNGSYATMGVMDSGFSLENNVYGGSPMSIRIGDGVHNTADNMAFAITASQSYGTSPQLIWAGYKVGKITTAYKTWDNPHGFIVADDIKFSTWDNTASTVIFDETINYQNWSPNQSYGYIDNTGTRRWFKVAGYDLSSNNRVVGIYGGGGRNGVGVDQTDDVWFSVKGKNYSLFAMLIKLNML
ncbi:hypothetical protein [Leuconostoc mesenteroides]|uniref:hypothetical protein n=1 Tax=Leuconostoc mesenteroides TaxID=1245 RepID=UPI0009FCAC73|nr:hypothetical protein [Leuconostoc mesenteroides]ORI39635.1 hypothetical protein BMR90_00910 [Leuconostoc mesenteroides subsp. cremoris]ORI42504.1 hypothetical protein BMR91_00895 [Leuconostoc mesenteroides subsp. cremoris]ORI44585.1 hypothetical protein BMR93_01720 [Leuconostoc mesenteroides subsp. cremoris]